MFNKNLKLNDFLVGFVENMSYIRNESIECIVCTNIFDYVEDMVEALKEIFRILKPVTFFKSIFF